ncbi:MAG: TIGR01906 family membrane protein [Clostridia bacterium]|nr:TIGR01906 family membrane protein [Clostridia bacterium]
MKDKVFGALLVLLWLLALVGCLFMTLRVLINDEAYFQRGYEKLDMQSLIGISDEDCTRSLMRMIDYMEGRVDAIQLTVTENGERVDMFNQQEIDHMVDVRTLYQAWRTVAWCALGALALLLALLVIKPCRALVLRALGRAWIVLGVAVAAAGIWVLADFNSFWMQFHYLFFDNDLWLMDPAVCRMIRICPIELFYGIVVRVGVVFLTAFGALPALGAILIKRRDRKEGRA